MYCMWLVENAGCKKLPKTSASGHHCRTLSGYIFATKACIDNRKKTLLNSNISSTCPNSMVNFSPLTAEIGSGVWGTPANFNRFCVFASLLHRCHSTDIKNTLQDVWPSFGLVHYVYIHFTGSCPLTEFFQLQNSLWVQVLHSPMLAALLHGTRAVAVSQTLWHGTRNGIMELLQRALPIFGWAAITLGIGPHSSWSRFLQYSQRYWCCWECPAENHQMYVWSQSLFIQQAIFSSETTESRV